MKRASSVIRRCVEKDSWASSRSCSPGLRACSEKHRMSPTEAQREGDTTRKSLACNEYGGGGGNRTRVRKGSYGSFYTLSRLVSYLAVRPLSGKGPAGQPVHLAPRLRVSPQDHPDSSSPRRAASGGPPGRRHGLSRESQRVVVGCFCPTGFTRRWPSACYSRLFLSVESSSPPWRMSSLKSVPRSGGASTRPVPGESGAAGRDAVGWDSCRSCSCSSMVSA